MTDPDKLSSRMPPEVRALVSMLNYQLTLTGLTNKQVADRHRLPYTGRQFHEQLHKPAGPNPLVYNAILETVATETGVDVQMLRERWAPAWDAVHRSPGPRASAAGTGGETSPIDARAEGEWLLEMLRSARDDEAVADLDQHFHGNNRVLAGVLIEIAEFDRYAVGLFLDTLAEKTSATRSVEVHKAIAELDEDAAAAIAEACDLVIEPDEALDVPETPLLIDRDPELGAGQRIATLLHENREKTRIVREIRLRAAADTSLALRIAQESSPENGVQLRPACSESFQRLIFGIGLSDLDNGPRWLAKLLQTLYDANETIALSHTVTALFDLRNEYGRYVFRAATKVFENVSQKAILHIVLDICTESRLRDAADRLTTLADLETLLWALSDDDISFVIQRVATLPPSVDFSAGHFVENLPPVSAFWRRLVSGPEKKPASALLGRALEEWAAWDHGGKPPEQYQPLQQIARALVDADAADRMQPNSARVSPDSPTTTMIKRLIVDRPAAAVLLLNTILLTNHLRVRGFLLTLVSDTGTLAWLTQTEGLSATFNNSILKILENPDPLNSWVSQREAIDPARAAPALASPQRDGTRYTSGADPDAASDLM
ncbi:hypothetical protein AB0L82_35440 [Nocardia sp. NPDC052001]|uniref:hypothetical protein n=1 Tax=Nocardia sp. NPDC052001 TaxID=3154853 RepID=UPI00343699F9